MDLLEGRLALVLAGADLIVPALYDVGALADGRLERRFR